MPQQSGSDQVCGAGAMLPAWKCTNLDTYAAARQQCHDVGARLCTAAELVADEPAWNSALAGCNDDTLAWSSDTQDEARPAASLIAPPSTRRS